MRDELRVLTFQRIRGPLVGYGLQVLQQRLRLQQQQQQQKQPPAIAGLLKDAGSACHPACHCSHGCALTLATAPYFSDVRHPLLPPSWSSYYLAHDNYGATKGVPWDYVVPASAVTELSLQPDSPIAQW